MLRLILDLIDTSKTAIALSMFLVIAYLTEAFCYFRANKGGLVISKASREVSKAAVKF